MNVQQASIERTNSSKLQDIEDTRLQGRSLVLARVVWFILVALAVLVLIFSLPVYIAQLYSICSGIACGTGQLTPQIVETLRNHGFTIGEYVTTTVLTLPAMNGRGFFLHPARLPIVRLDVRVEAVCPEAFPAEADVSLCPRVHANAFARILRAAL